MQRRFQFRLERVLRVRAIQERVARAEWGSAQAQLLAAEAKRDARSRGLASSRQELSQGVESGAIAPEHALLMERTLDAEMFGLASASEEVHSKLVSAEQLAAAWRLRDQDQRSLAELEDRARTTHRRELEAEENQELDEMAIGRSERMRQQRREFPQADKDSEIYSRSTPDPAE